MPFSLLKASIDAFIVETDEMLLSITSATPQPKGWRCFWFDAVFTELAFAEMHFGAPHSGKPLPECGAINRRFAETARLRLTNGQRLTDEEIKDLCDLAARGAATARGSEGRTSGG